LKIAPTDWLLFSVMVQDVTGLPATGAQLDVKPPKSAGTGETVIVTTVPREK
jgi:hypothetical protein